MCGRTACTLNSDDISKLCRYRRRNGKSNEPKWGKNKDKYFPSYNKAPRSYCPVMVSRKHMDGDCLSDERELDAMRWGLIPSWFQGDSADKVNYNMNNARADTIMEKRSYKIPLRKGQRCVVVADGFYEWNTSPKGKQPYYIYLSQPNEEGKISQLLTMAGIFETTCCGGEDIYSFTIITVDASPEFAWLHHRMPAILENDDEIAAWLDFENVPLDKALSLIKPKNCLQYHPVSKLVNNSRNNSPECIMKLDPEEDKKEMTSSSNRMMNWLKSASTNIPSQVGTSLAPKKRSATTLLDKWVKKSKVKDE